MAYADLVFSGHRETWAVHSPRFRAWLRRWYFEATGGRPERAGAQRRLPVRTKCAVCPRHWQMEAAPGYGLDNPQPKIEL
jgi:hypothetical protein